MNDEERKKFEELKDKMLRSYSNAITLMKKFINPPFEFTEDMRHMEKVMDIISNLVECEVCGLMHLNSLECSHEQTKVKEGEFWKWFKGL